MQNVDRLSLGKQYYELHKSGGGRLDWQQIANQNSTTYNIVREAARYYKRSVPPNTDPPDLHIVPRPSPAPQGADERRELLRAYLGTTLTVPAAKARKPGDRRKIIVCADLHGHPSKDVLHAIIAQQPDMIVIAGDLLDSAQVNPHPTMAGESNKADTIRGEMANVRAWIETLLMNTHADVKICRGNHDSWSWRQATELLPPALLDFFQDPFDVLLSELPASRVERVLTIWQYHHADKSTSELGGSEYMMMCGDALISHCNFVGSKAGDAVNKLLLWVNKWRRTLGIDPTLMIQSHVHRCALLESDGGSTVLVEPGAAFDPIVESYKPSYQAKWSPASIGCCVFEQQIVGTDWRTDLGSVNLIRPRRSVVYAAPTQNKPQHGPDRPATYIG